MLGRQGQSSVSNVPTVNVQGVVVRDEGDVFVIWTKRFNHIYVREENFNRLEHYVYDWIGIVVVAEARPFRDYTYEGVRCVTLNPNESQDPTTSPDEEYTDIQKRRMVCEFQKCEDSRGRTTLRWRDKFELAESSGRVGIIRSVRRANGQPGFIERAILPGSDREKLEKNRLTTFDAFVMLDFAANENERTPWRLHKYYIDGEMDINGFLGRSGCLLRGPGGVPVDKRCATIPPDALIPKRNPVAVQTPFNRLPPPRSVEQEIWGLCLAKFHNHCGFYVSAACYGGNFSERPLRLPLSMNMLVGNWYRLHFLGREDRLSALYENTAPPDFFTKVDHSPPLETELISHVPTPCNTGEHTLIELLVRADVRLSKETITSKHILWMSDTGVIAEKVVPFMAKHNMDEASFIIQISLSMNTGFLVTAVLDVDSGQPLAEYSNVFSTIVPDEDVRQKPVPAQDCKSHLTSKNEVDQRPLKTPEEIHSSGSSIQNNCIKGNTNLPSSAYVSTLKAAVFDVDSGQPLAEYPNVFSTIVPDEDVQQKPVPAQDCQSHLTSKNEVDHRPLKTPEEIHSSGSSIQNNCIKGNTNLPGSAYVSTLKALTSLNMRQLIQEEELTYQYESLVDIIKRNA